MIDILAGRHPYLGKPRAKGFQVPTRVRLIHKTLLDGRFHVYTSPDVKGLHVSADTKPEAQRDVVAVLDAIAARRGWGKPEVVFKEEASLRAA